MKRFIVCVCFLILCGGFSFSQVKENIVHAQSISLLSEITITHEGKEWQYFKPNFENFYLESLKQQKEQEILRQGIRNFAIQKKGQGASDIQIIDEIYFGFAKFFSEISSQIEKEFKECEIEFSPNKKSMWEFQKEQTGIKINTADLLLNICLGNNKIELKTEKQEPKFTKNSLEIATTLRSQEHTSFAGSESGRRFNIIKALDCFNGLIVFPNEKISFQKILAKNDNGIAYKEATVIVNGEFVKGVGGGVCQASTTIFNAILMAGLEILEVHSHTLPVGYVERGFDAMVNDSGLDLRFRNNTAYPIYVKTYSKNSQAYAEVYGTQMDYTLKKVSEQVEKINPPDPKIIPDEKGEYSKHIEFKGEYFTKRYAQYGYKVNAYLEVYENNQLKETRTIRKGTTYAPTQSIIYEGTKEKTE